MNKWIYIILLIIFLIFFLSTYYTIKSHEKYKFLKNIGISRINLTHKNTHAIDENKYSGHRYRQRRRYNHLGQGRRYE